jgi:hypothetical protein
VAETSEQARQDVKFGLEDFKRYFSEVATFPIIPPDITTDPAEYLVSSGHAKSRYETAGVASRAAVQAAIDKHQGEKA